ncbi:hypothetical protein THMIRHAM_14770 [Thiomicrorhabdus immobilis]|uniref:Uncharacterized protein n=1 Tax=Thiomicrorhabdus immobilis TaxID=2791037 RepID=A0ABN6D0L2_9GAMM|nr:EAL domain-containing protein [Thiomicrorhabdus immobilis]BCN93692.1 hypothetical protein THMIRHAM_14770 [Thiomicrorhabdus immobilis]
MSLFVEEVDLETIQKVLSLFPNPVTLNRRRVDENGEEYDEILYVNPEFTQSIGYNQQDIPTDRDWFTIAYPDKSYQHFIFQEWFAELKQARRDNQTLLGIPARVTCKDGSEKWFQITSHIESNIADNCHLVVFVEIDTPEELVLELQAKSELLIQKNERLKSSELALRETQKNAQIGSWEVDLIDGSLSWSEEMFTIYGEDPKSFQPSMDDFYSRLGRDDVKHIQKEMQLLLTTGEPRQTIVNVTKSDNSYLTLQIFGKAIFDEHGTPIKLFGSTIDITRKTQLQKENDELARLIRVAQQELYIVDYETDQYLYVNDSASSNTGYSVEELLSFSVYDLNPFLTPENVQGLKTAGKNLDKMKNVSVHRRKDGSYYPVHGTLQRINYRNRPCYAVFDADISDLKDAEQALQNQFNLLQNIVNNVPVRIFWKDIDGRYLGANKLFLEDAQLASLDELIGKTDKEMPWAATDGDAYRIDDLAVMTSRTPKLHFEEEQTNEEGETIVLSTSKVPLENAHGEVIGILGTYEDISERRRIENTLVEQQNILHYQAHHDSLTNLPNRLLLQDRLKHAIFQANRNDNQFALLFIDLDHFKQINDSMGHEVGDLVLKEVASRLQNSIRKSDTLARLGGDEFTIVMEDIEHVRDISLLAQKIINITKEAFLINNDTFYLSSSVGISIYPSDAENAESLLKYADAAMYRAKDNGRDNFQFYTEDMTQVAFEHVAMQASLRQAILNNEFEVYYQPQINALENKIIGMEALVRWKHPSLGIVTPDKFIPIAEETGMIVDLDRLVMKSAMKQWSIWYSQGLNPGVLSINLAVKQVQKADFIDFLQNCILHTQCRAEWLTLELTESDIMKNLEAMKQVLVQVKSLGIGIAIDDFGTGYSSLAYLKRLPVSKLKIDRSFIKDLPEDDEDSTIARIIIMMAKNLGIDVLAEGVETSEQRDFLLESGCAHIQGFFYSRPMPNEETLKYIQQWNQD